MKEEVPRGKVEKNKSSEKIWKERKEGSTYCIRDQQVFSIQEERRKTRNQNELSQLRRKDRTLDCSNIQGRRWERGEMLNESGVSW